MNIGTALDELVIERFIAPIEMINTMYGGLTFCHQRGKNQADRCAQVRGHHFRPVQSLNAADESSRSLQRNIGAEPAELRHMHEPAFEYRFPNDRGARRNCH